VLADCLAEWTGAESIPARAAAFRVAEMINLVYSLGRKR
jgi:hypothetical protein